MAAIGAVAGGCPSTPENTTSESTTTGSDCDPGSLDCECYDDSTCDGGLICASNLCVDDSPVTAGTQTTTGTTTGPSTDTDTTGTTDGTETSSGTTSSLECDPGLGLVNEACADGNAPYCADDGSCGDCTAIDCAGLTGTTVCDPGIGLCVECSAEDASACSGVSPVCDAATNTCVACTEHEDCKSGACNLFTGACFPGDALYVDKSVAPGGCAGATGAEDKPYCEIQDAVATVGKNEPTIIWVKPAATSYASKVTVESARIVAIRSTNNSRARLEVSDTDSFQISQGGVALLDRLQIGYSSEDRGVFCSGGKLWADDSWVVDRGDVGVDAMSGCALWLRRAKIEGNEQGGIRIVGGELHLENTFIVNNGWDGSLVGGVSTSAATQVDVLYTSLIRNYVNDLQSAASMKCSDDTSGTVRNSILLGGQNIASIECAGIEVEYSAVDKDKLVPDGSNNTLVSSYDFGWFVNPPSDFHLKSGVLTPFKDVGLWSTGDPSIDHDGDLRPTEDTAPDFVGADIPK
ncbi:MAG: hypothetical protein R3A79_25800 [Nannocystaceae bacterium]